MTSSARGSAPESVGGENANGKGAHDRPVEFWPTAAIKSALDAGDIEVWQRIVVAIKRDPFGRTARQVEEVLGDAPAVELSGIARALAEVLVHARQHLESQERSEVAQHIQLLLDRSGLSRKEFASRVGVPSDDLALYLEARVSPPASLVIRMRRLSDRFARIRAHRPGTN